MNSFEEKTAWAIKFMDSLQESIEEHIKEYPIWDLASSVDDLKSWLKTVPGKNAKSDWVSNRSPIYAIDQRALWLVYRNDIVEYESNAWGDFVDTKIESMIILWISDLWDELMPHVLENLEVEFK